jgi:hypothetical protein
VPESVRHSGVEGFEHQAAVPKTAGKRGGVITCGGGLAAVPEVHTQRPAPIQLQQEQH